VVVTLGFEVVACLIVARGHELQGAIFGGAALATLAGVFVYGTRSRRAERRERAQIMSDQLKLPLDEVEGQSASR
jgi:hypothetical protein